MVARDAPGDNVLHHGQCRRLYRSQTHLEEDEMPYMLSIEW